MDTKEFLYQQYKIAIDTRKLELELFWKRSLFFAGFISAAFAVYSSANSVKLPMAALGLFLSVSWFLANKGSKYWYETWEIKVNALEECLEREFSELNDGLIAHKLFQAWLDEKGYWWHLTRGSRWSVSRLTIMISIAIIPPWIYAFLKEISYIKLLAIQHVNQNIYDLAWIMYFLFIATLLIFTKTGKPDNMKQFNLTLYDVKYTMMSTSLICAGKKKTNDNRQ